MKKYIFTAFKHQKKEARISAI